MLQKGQGPTYQTCGAVVLTPAVVMPKLEAELLRANPAFAANLKEKMRHPERLRRRPLPSE